MDFRLARPRAVSASFPQIRRSTSERPGACFASKHAAQLLFFWCVWLASGPALLHGCAHKQGYRELTQPLIDHVKAWHLNSLAYKSHDLIFVLPGLLSEENGQVFEPAEGSEHVSFEGAPPGLEVQLGGAHGPRSPPFPRILGLPGLWDPRTVFRP